VRGDPGLGAMLRGLRASRLLTQTQVATRVCCDASLVSMVESGRRALQPDLAQRLDHLYGTGTVITGLASSLAYPSPPGCATLGPGDDVVLVQLPLRGVTVPVSRRTLLAALSIGATSSSLGNMRDAVADLPADEELLTEMTNSLAAWQSAGRIMPPTQLVDPLLGQVAVLDVVRRRAPDHLGRCYTALQAQYAEYLGWMVQESGDLQGASYWIDRAQQWGDQARWAAMSAYGHVRRSMLVSTCTGDGPLAVEHAQRALVTPDAPALVKALAAKQMAYGYALAGRPDACHRALDHAEKLHAGATPHDQGPGPVIGLTSTSIDDQVMLAQFRATCDVYLGGGEHAVAALSSYRTAYGPTARRGVINGARLARAHAQAGDPDRACVLAVEALDTGQVLDSWTTRIELRRTLKPLARWPGREDVTEVRHRVTALV
jgi:transcriptional regulator with XRE-family HTH domain